MIFQKNYCWNSCYAKANNIKLNPRFKIPIVFYLPYERDVKGKAKQHRVSFYTESMRLGDLAQASQLYDNSELRRDKFAQSDYEILLGQPKITLKILMQPGTVYKSSLAIDMIDRGYVRMLMRLLRSNNLRETLFNELLKQKLIKQNDPIISHFVEVEAFDIASKLLRETNSDIEQLSFRNGKLVDHIFSNGTPRQVNYLCTVLKERSENAVEEILLRMVKKSCWHTIRLYLKEYPVQDKKVLGRLLSEDSWRKTPCDTKFLLQRGADVTGVNHLKRTPIVTAAQCKNWEQVSLICDHHTDSDGTAQFGVALVLALSEKKMDLVDKLLKAGAKPPQDFYMGDTKKLKKLISFVATHAKKETFTPFIRGLKIFWHDFKELFLDCCRTKNYSIPEFLLTLDIKMYSDCLPQNDPLMSSLIIDEQFKIADKLIEATRSDKFQLYVDRTLLADHIIEKGTLSQFNYMGQEKMFTRVVQKIIIQNRDWERLHYWLGLVEASQGLDEKLFTHIVNSLCASRVHWLIPDWVAMRSFVEQYLRYFNSELLGKVLVIAFNDSQFLFSNYLLEKGADKSAIKEFRFPIECAAEHKRWDFVLELCQKSPGEDEGLIYGEVLKAALGCRETEVARKLLDQGAIPSWKIHGVAYPLATARFYQLINEIGNLPDSELDDAIYDCYFQCICEMLLTLPEVSSWQLMWEVYFGRPFAIEMIENGHSTTLITLLSKHELYTTNVIRSASIRNYLKKNNSFISECICANAFRLVDKIILATKTDKRHLQLGGSSLMDHLAFNGNLDQRIYMGLELIMFRIILSGDWERIRQGFSEIQTLNINKRDLFVGLIDEVRNQALLRKKMNWTIVQNIVEQYSEYFDAALLGRLLLVAFEDQHTHVGQSLLKKMFLLSSNETEIDEVVKILVSKQFIKSNDHFIAECICENLLVLADKLINTTFTRKNKLQYKGYGLADHLVYHGTFEQWTFFGIEAIVFEIARKNYWDWAMGEIDRNRSLFGCVFLGELFYEACKQYQHQMAKRLLSYGADMTSPIDSKPPLVYLVDEQRWDFVDLFCEYPSDEKDDAEYGYAVVQALRNNKVQLARTLFSLGAIHVDRSRISCLLESAVFYAVKLELIDWIPQLIQYQLERDEKFGWAIKVNKFSARQFQLRPFSFHQILLARDFAEFKDNPEVMSYFEEFNSLDFSPGCSLTPWYCDEWDYERVLTAQFFIEALAMNEVPFAAHRLIKYAQKYKLISTGESSVPAVLSKIASHCFYAIKTYNSNIREIIYHNLRRILEQEIQCGNIPASENAFHGNLTFFPDKSSDKLFVARILSTINVNEINSYAEYLKRSVVQRVEVLEDDHKTSPAVLVYG